MGVDNKLNIRIGKLQRGKLNKITDVPGVKVGHFTLDDGENQTGVTAILPHNGNLFKEKLMAGCHIINGFGKSTGLIQINELGTIETPIILTNTFGVGTAYNAIVKYMLNQNKDIGNTTGTVNPVICECNDGKLNDIRNMSIKEEDIFLAIENSCDDFAEGDIGAGRGMSCHQLKGGIGSSSRIIDIDDYKYTIGAIVLSNHGLKEDLIIDGRKIGQKLVNKKENYIDMGSIITVIATDIPLSERQLNRLCKRVPVGLSRTGSFINNGSGEIAIAFTTANKINHYSNSAIESFKMMRDDKIDIVFRAVAEIVEESVLSSLINSNTVIGKNGMRIENLNSLIDLNSEFK
ncbi:MAG: P1 family peptidase [Tissierellia bacterium]|nr:P1 family peptidase [Tissierellia bacterium]